jgi:hypothetical protein
VGASAVTVERRRRPFLTAVPAIVWAGAFLGYLFRDGLILDREQLLLWICLGLAATSLASPTRLKRLIVDWLPFAVALTAYDYTRGVADTLGMPLQKQSIADVDKFLFFGHVPSVWLQAHIDMTQPPRWWHAVITLVYTSHLIVPFAIAGYLWWRDRQRWVRWTRRFFILTAAGLTTYILVPAAPPWYASREGIIGPVTRSTTNGWGWLHLRIARTLLDKGQETVNLVAAFPSLHAAFSMLACAYFWPKASAPMRVLLLSYAVGMGFVLVLGGEHYVTDILAGWLYVAGACWIARRWERRRSGRLEVEGDPGDPGSADGLRLGADEDVARRAGHEGGDVGGFSGEALRLHDATHEP